ncbi:MAG: hypothetical protein GXO70_11740 [Acidobacteria bacterium]|nr:hypothetical protein [Acidobacteriota bacterium]
MIVSFIFWIVIRRFLHNVPERYRGILSAGLTPAVLGLSLGYILLLVPQLPSKTIRIGYLFFSFILLGVSLYYQSKPEKKQFDFSLLLPVLICLPVFFIVTRTFVSFDPANYALIGKAFIPGRMIRDFPFILPGRGSPVFSWFAHPPLLSLIYSWLSLFHLNVLAPYVSTIFFMFLLVLFFITIREKTNLLIATVITMVLASTPIAVTTATMGFTAPLRMFFFTAVGLLMVNKESDFPAITVGIFAGVAMASHTIGLLTLPGVIGYLFLRYRQKALNPAFRFLITSIIVGGFWYGWNLVQLGALDATPVFLSTFPELTKKAIAFQFSQRGMISSSDILIKGILGPVTRISIYGISFLFGFVSLLSAIIRRQYRPPLALSVLLVTYLAFHLLPGHFRIAILSPRYPLTVLPLLLIAGAYGFQGRIFHAIGFLAASFAFLATIFFWNPYKQKPDYYKSMVQTVKQFVSPEDQVLVVHTPYFFLYNQKKGRDSMDPVLADLYHQPSINNVLTLLKEKGFTHILMPWAPTPFESDSFVRDLFTNPGLVKLLGHNRAFYLYKILYPQMPVPPPSTHSHQFVSDIHTLPMVAYSDVSGKPPVRFWDNGDAIQMFSPGKKTIFAFANGPLWEQNAGSIPIKKSRKLMVLFKLGHIPKPILIYPIISQYNRKGDRICLSHPKPVKCRQGRQTLIWPTSYPGFNEDWLCLAPTCEKIAIGFSFYREKGGISIEKLDVVGLH